MYCMKESRLVNASFRLATWYTDIFINSPHGSRMEVVSSQDSLGIAMIHHGNTSTKMFVCWFNPASDRWLAGGGADGEETSEVVSSYWIICNNDFQFPGERKDRKSDSRQLLRPLMFISHCHWDPRCETKHCHQLYELLLLVQHTGKPLRFTLELKLNVWG